MITTKVSVDFGQFITFTRDIGGMEYRILVSLDNKKFAVVSDSDDSLRVLDVYVEQGYDRLLFIVQRIITSDDNVDLWDIVRESSAMTFTEYSNLVPGDSDVYDLYERYKERKSELRVYTIQYLSDTCFRVSTGDYTVFVAAEGDVAVILRDMPKGLCLAEVYGTNNPSRRVLQTLLSVLLCPSLHPVFYSEDIADSKMFTENEFTKATALKEKYYKTWLNQT